MHWVCRVEVSCLRLLSEFGDLCSKKHWCLWSSHCFCCLRQRVPDVFFCQMLAKRVLREVCIMRRLAHPYIISCKLSHLEEYILMLKISEHSNVEMLLKCWEHCVYVHALTPSGIDIVVTDVFSSKNLEKPDSTDLYIATEFAERYGLIL